MSNRKLPIANTSGYNLYEDTPDHSQKPEPQYLVLQKTCDTPTSAMADLLAQHFKCKAEQIRPVLDSLNPEGMITLNDATTLEICETQGMILGEKKEVLQSTYPELENYCFAVVPASNFEI